MNQVRGAEEVRAEARMENNKIKVKEAATRALEKLTVDGDMTLDQVMTACQTPRMERAIAMGNALAWKWTLQMMTTVSACVKEPPLAGDDDDVMRTIGVLFCLAKDYQDALEEKAEGEAEQRRLEEEAAHAKAILEKPEEEEEEAHAKAISEKPEEEEEDA